MLVAVRLKRDVLVAVRLKIERASCRSFKNVSEDYATYQIYDIVQAFSSTFAVCTFKVTNTSARNSLISNFDFYKFEKKYVQFLALLASQLQIRKTLRLIFANSAKECLGHSWRSREVKVTFAGGVTRAALTQHQAVRGNLADVNSKDSSQETCVNLIASFVGLYFLTVIKGPGNSVIRDNNLTFKAISHRAQMRHRSLSIDRACGSQLLTSIVLGLSAKLFNDVQLPFLLFIQLFFSYKCLVLYKPLVLHQTEIEMSSTTCWNIKEKTVGFTPNFDT
uniref:Protein root UVB sensitive/RUS domain-containing protein n=1 Tax=Glossina austeni TaxID=7395 RepID=A0A1A9UKZ2_GLOAU